MHKSLSPVLILVMASLLLAACRSSGGSGQAGDAVQGYLVALVNRDASQMIALSCADWEAGARQEYDSFAAVTLKSQDVACQQTGSQGQAAVVSCTGKLIANYGAEDLEIDIAERPFRVVQEAGEWRMCGYAQP